MDKENNKVAPIDTVEEPILLTENNKSKDKKEMIESCSTPVKRKIF